jgi:hypothetical protein
LVKFTASLKVWVPDVVILPFSSVVPLALVVKLAALTVLLNLVMTVELALRLPRGLAAEPTAPPKVILPVPLVTVKF